MKTVKAIVFILLVFAAHANSQNVIPDPSARALIFADSLVSAFRYNNWDQYTELSCPGVVKYYGGKKGYTDYVQRARTLNASIEKEEKEKIELLQIQSDDISEWQCVIRKTRHTVIDNRKAKIITYLVGQSKDEGQTWKYVDVAFNSVENMIYIMPDIFDTLAIPQRSVIFDKEEMARN